jgi:fucose permease
VQTSQKPDVVYWGARASNWLMSSRDLSYLDANRFLMAYNLATIRAAPLNTLLTMAQSAVYFQFPAVPAEWPTILRLAVSGIELLWMTGFWLVLLLWLSLHLVSKLGWLTKHLTHIDLMVALTALCFLYTMAVSSGVDVGKPEHRLPVQMLVVILIVIGIRELIVGRNPFSETSTP